MATLRANARTTPGDVADLLDAPPANTDDLIPFVNAASYQVDRIEAEAPGADAALLAEVETWLAAHLSTTRNTVLSSEKQESYSADFLRETSYGETAMNLDPTSVLSGGALIDFSAVDAKGIR